MDWAGVPPAARDARRPRPACARRRVGEPAGARRRRPRWPIVTTPTGSKSSGIANAARTASLLVRRDADEAGAEALVGRGLQDQQAAIAVSMCQNGFGQRASSRSVQPLSASAYRSQVGGLAGARQDHHRRAHHAGQPAVGLRRCRRRSRAQKRRTSSGVSSTRNAQPWLKPALGARVALRSARSTIAGSTGLGRRSCGPSGGGGRRPGTPWSEILCLTTSSGCGATSPRSAGRPRPAATSASRSPRAERELRAWFVEQCERARAAASRPTASATSSAGGTGRGDRTRRC